ncbi:hypothetical protein BD414DRAFT_533462 [Trametes punicea]|nr:hypothetical protein BD414DRAFT_533462 [Trametes punicea]
MTVAHVAHIRRYPRVTILDLEDGTKDGWISAKRWLTDQGSDGLPTQDAGFYVHILGKLIPGLVGGKNNIEVKAIRVVTDPHQIFFHILQVAFVTLALERGLPPLSVKLSVGPRIQTASEENQISPPSAPTTPAAPRIFKGGHVQTPLSSPALRSPSPSPLPRLPVAQPVSATRSREISPRSSNSPSPGLQGVSTPRATGVRRDPHDDLTVLERAILLQIFNANPAQGGVSLKTIVRGVCHHDVTATQIGNALDVLSDKGYISVLPDGIHYTVKTPHYPTLT